MIPRFFQVATCDEVFDGKRRPCLYYHLDQCLAPCAGKTNPEEYGKAVADAKLFLEGRHKDLTASLTRHMQDASEAQQYEKAARYRDTLRTVDRLGIRQAIDSAGLEDRDTLAHHVEGRQVALQVFEMRAGKVQARREFTFDDLDFEPAAFYAQVLVQLYADAAPPPEIELAALPADAELLTAWLTERAGRKVALHVPERGSKRRFLATVEKNAALAFDARFRARHSHGVEVLESLAEAIGLAEAPYRIEAFDISNIHGTDSVASMVVWENGKPKPSDYRIFNIKSVEGPDDFASIAEAVTRRYRRLLAEGRRLPDLVLIDGGPGQLGAAVRAAAAFGLPTIPMVSLAKRDEEIFLQGQGEPVRLDRSSPALQLLQRIRDEAHRFGIKRHRAKRSRRTLTTALLEIPGVGPKTAKALLRAFGSVAGVKRASTEQVAVVAGEKVARVIALWAPPGDLVRGR
jgi:excinuclease ABC subunit C